MHLGFRGLLLLLRTESRPEGATAFRISAQRAAASSGRAGGIVVVGTEARVGVAAIIISGSRSSRGRGSRIGSGRCRNGRSGRVVVQ